MRKIASLTKPAKNVKINEIQRQARTKKSIYVNTETKY